MDMLTKRELPFLVLKRLGGTFLGNTPVHTEHIERHVRKSLFIRQVDGGSSNAVEQEIAAIFNPVYDAERFGIQLVTSPRHADILLLTGPLTRNMRNAVLAAFHAMPIPRRVVTVGDGFDHRGVFDGSYAIVPLPDEITAARVAHIPGDPPTPLQILDVLLKLDTSPSKAPSRV